MIAIAATVLNALWQDALLVIAVWLVLHAWPRINAATRYAVWIATLLAALVVPILTTAAFFTASPSAATPAQSVSRTTLERAVVAPPLRHQREIRTIAVPGATAWLPTRLHVTLPLRVALVVFAAWALLTGYAVIGLLVGLARLERLKRDALPLPVECRDSMPQWSAANKGRRPVRLCVSEAIDVPVAVGLFDAMILIPQSLLEHLSPAEVEQISLHELAHLRRADDWSNCLQRLIVAALGWNPAAIFIGQQLELEREVACDDWVLASVGAVRPYAMCLTKMAETAAWPRRPMPAPGVFTTRKQISLRIERLLASGRDIATTLAVAPAAAAAAAVAALAIVIFLVAPSVAAPAITVATATASAPAVTPAPTPTPRVTIVRVAVPTAPTAPAVRAAEVDALVRKSIAKERSATVSQAAIAQSSGMSCTGCDLHGVNWAGRDLRGANYTGADFSHANLAGVNLSQSVLRGTDFTKANLSGASFRRAQLTGVEFTNADLRSVDFAGAALAACDFSDARLDGANFAGATLDECDLDGVDLRRVDLSKAKMTDVDIPERSAPP